MIKFNELTLSADGKVLTVNVQVMSVEDSDGKDYFEDIKITDIWIDTISSYVEGKGVSSLYTDDNPTLGRIYVSEEGVKSVELYYDVQDFNSDMYIVYVNTSGALATNTPCSYKNISQIGVAYNRCKLFAYSSGLINTMDGCEPNKNLIMELLKLKTFEIALKTGHIAKGISLWGSFFNKDLSKSAVCGSTSSSTVTQTYPYIKTCGCNE